MIVGTRGSELALIQSNYIRQRLFDFTNDEVEIQVIKTTGDKITSPQLYNMDSKGLFTKELDLAVLDEEVDFAVHSLKDVPTELNEDLEIAAIPIRESPNEVLVSKYSWDELPFGATLGTSSLRREAFCNLHKKKLEMKPIRGNIGTRIKKILNNELDATIMAEAGLNRLNLKKYIKNKFPLDYITPAAGQGALAIITRKDSDVKDVIRNINHFKSEQEVIAEKIILEELGVGCQWPIGSIARANNNELCLYSILLTKNGEVLHKTKLKGSINQGNELGNKVAQEMKDYI